MSQNPQAKSFTEAAKIALVQKKLSITTLAKRIRFARNTVSRTINHPTIHPRVRSKIAKVLEIAS